MLTLRVAQADVANMRFAISPLVEVSCSARALAEPESRALHLPWITHTRAAADAADLELLIALQPRDAYTPDFLHPPPSSPLAELEDELEEMVPTPPDRIRAEIHAAYSETGVPRVLAPFVTAPDAATARLAQVIRRYWELAIAPHWARLRGLLEGDVLYRARRMADSGVAGLLADLHPAARYDGSALVIDKPFARARVLNGRGLLFVPSAFVWPRMSAITEPPWQPTLIYPARGIAALWEPGAPATAAAIGTLLRPRRAAVLAGLDAPRSTTELARHLGLSAASVSQHLGVLRAAGLVRGARVGRAVLYARTARGDGLLD